jgi:MerR family transcriptional regulator, heat shock protein HspR
MNELQCLTTVFDVHGSEKLSVEELAVRTTLHPAVIRQYIEIGLIRTAEHQGGTYFHPAEILRVRLIRRLRESLGINLAGVSVVLDLLERMEALRREIESLRAKA